MRAHAAGWPGRRARRLRHPTIPGRAGRGRPNPHGPPGVSGARAAAGVRQGGACPGALVRILPGGGVDQAWRRRRTRARDVLHRLGGNGVTSRVVHCG